MKVLITGTSGFLGSHLVKGLHSSPEFTLFAVDRAVYEPSHTLVEEAFLLGDSRPGAFFEQLSEKISPDVVVHAAARSSFFGCEIDPLETEEANVSYTEAVAQFCKKTSARLIFISTDLVFDGNGLPEEGGFTEEVTPLPLSKYATTKVQGENIVAHVGESSLILRISLLYGPVSGRGGGPLCWAVEAEKEGKPITAFMNEWRTPLYVGDLVMIIERALQSKISGTYHVGGSERVNRVQFFEEFLQVCSGDPSLLREASRTDVEGPKRPEDVSLSSAKLCNDLGVELTPLIDGLRASLL